MRGAFEVRLSFCALEAFASPGAFKQALELLERRIVTREVLRILGSVATAAVAAEVCLVGADAAAMSKWR